MKNERARKEYIRAARLPQKVSLNEIAPRFLLQDDSGVPLSLSLSASSSRKIRDVAQRIPSEGREHEEKERLPKANSVKLLIGCSP